MKLPSITVPTFKAIVPSTQQEVTLRTYLVKEEKMFLMAQESKDANAAFDTLKQVLNNCSYGQLDVDKLAVFDVEYLFLQLRAESVGAECKVAFRCQNKIQLAPDTEDVTCGTLVPFVVNLKEVKVVVPEGHSATVQIEDNLWMKMRYPALGEAAHELATTGNVTESVMSVIASCVDMIYSKTESSERPELAQEDIVKFLDELRPAHFKAIQRFFLTMPRLQHTLQFKCTKCGYQQPIEMQGMESFLA